MVVFFLVFKYCLFFSPFSTKRVPSSYVYPAWHEVLINYCSYVPICIPNLNASFRPWEMNFCVVYFRQAVVYSVSGFAFSTILSTYSHTYLSPPFSSALTFILSTSILLLEDSSLRFYYYAFEFWRLSWFCSKYLICVIFVVSVPCSELR